ncbi:MAG: glycerol kinase GlpK [Planctomycetes bacterium]|nr:glycerol kinase GlpK [Planctomycetota bacterium]MCH9727513.1 glycerol kinase GlpK [Planctomycetota bacterium]MCH9777505.1 glycerol kinase GlpK [Planctomycetota bacterium]MCH9792373.1 glycerol kinase GlpK [Planctomycetota bacterium]
MTKYVLALDQGTTSSRSILFNHQGQIEATAQQEFEQIFPSPGLVEHNPDAIWDSQLATAQKVIQQSGTEPADIAAIGITNQRETIVLWDRETGKPVSNAIVWQSRLTAGRCDQLKAEGYETLFREKTGLVLDAYFSGSKIEYLLNEIEGLRSQAQAGKILVGTIDTFLIWRLTGGKVHVTDPSNACRTLLYNIHTHDWDDELLAVFDIPRCMLPEVKDSSEVYGETAPELFGAPIKIAGIAGDQQAATFGQGCFESGAAKNTYGTGCFMLMNTGAEPVPSSNGLLTTIGWRINGKVTYCLEGSVFIAGAAIQWLRDGLQIIKSAPEVEELAAQVEDSGDVFFVPAFVGLGAPYWNQNARGTLIGLTRGSTKEHIARAVLESLAYQSCDVLHAMEQDSGIQLKTLKVDGGAAANNLLMQFQADMLDVPVQRPVVHETTALGAAYLAGLAVGFWQDQEEVTQNWALDAEYHSAMESTKRDHLYQRWQKAVERSRDWA